MLTFVGPGRSRTRGRYRFRKLIDGYCEAWSTGTADAPAKFYAQDDGLVFYDVAPFAYHGWKEYHDGVQTAILNNAASIKLTAEKIESDPPRPDRLDDCADALAEKTKEGKTMELDLRTPVFGKARCELGARHEHLSTPLAGN